MPDRLPPELERLRDRAERFADDVLDPLAARLALGTLDAAAVRREVTRASREAGLHGMTQPAAAHDRCADVLALTVVRDALASRNTGLERDAFGPGPGVLAGCAQPLRSRYLEPLLAGQKRSGFAVTEPADAPHYTRAAPDGGGGYVVDGRKSYVTRGADADFLAVLVDVPQQGRAVLIVDTGAPGVSIERRFETLDGSHHAAFRFDAVRVPADRMVGRPGEGMPRALGQIGDTRLAIAARVVGLARWTVGHIHEHLQRAGGPVPPGARDGPRLRYADMRIATYAARSMVYRTARLADAGANVVNEGIACKLFATRALSDLVEAAMEIVGGRALVLGHPLERLYREARALRTAEGADDMLRLSLARGSLELGKGCL